MVSINFILHVPKIKPYIYTDSGLKEWIDLLHETKEFEPKMLSSDEEIIVSLVNKCIILPDKKQFPYCIFS